MEENKKKILIYIGITFGLAWIIVAFIPLTGHSYGEIFSVLMLAGCMFTPTIGNLLTRIITKEGFADFKLKPKFKGNLKYYILSYFIFTILIAVGVVGYYLIFPQQFDINVMTQMPGAQANSTAAAIVGYIVIAALISPIINIIPTLGEEIGWRGYLLYKLQNKMGAGKAILISGVIWGLWHAPMIAIGHNYGTAYWGYPVSGILMMVLFCVTIGNIEGFLTLKTDSVIPAAICHSAVNGFSSVGMLFCMGDPNPLFGPTLCGFIVMLPALIFSLFLLGRLKRTK